VRYAARRIELSKAKKLAELDPETRKKIVDFADLAVARQKLSLEKAGGDAAKAKSLHTVVGNLLSGRGYSTDKYKRFFSLIMQECSRRSHLPSRRKSRVGMIKRFRFPASAAKKHALPPENHPPKPDEVVLKDDYLRFAAMFCPALLVPAPEHEPLHHVEVEEWYDPEDERELA